MLNGDNDVSLIRSSRSSFVIHVRQIRDLSMLETPRNGYTHHTRLVIVQLPFKLQFLDLHPTTRKALGVSLVILKPRYLLHNECDSGIGTIRPTKIIES